ncbi:hypothetical protein [Ghiorsea bivora]|uniref:hypothetical protein n=1 Tax=Ghiorsea bivora TaxID=1485545 RepID=UPI00056F5319|nr:hypothetical protein [Ghiorsea bivora]
MLCSLVSQAQAADVSNISKAEQSRIADLIFKNECNRKFECLVSWNDGEDFPSLGIGHFIWFPKGSNAPFQESFPDLMRWYQQQGVIVPERLSNILQPNQSSPWQNKAEFLQDENKPQIEQLRQFLADTQDVQASFIMQRLADALPKMLAIGQNQVEKDKIKHQFERVSASPNGWYALIDYVNFKGEGIKETERYHGKGWGLAQVLLNMDHEGNALRAFVSSAKQMLQQRVSLSPPERNEQRWLNGWLKRLDTY